MNGLVQDARDFNTLEEFLARRDVPQMSAAALQQAVGAPRAEMVLLFGGSLPEGCRLAGRLWLPRLQAELTPALGRLSIRLIDR